MLGPKIIGEAAPVAPSQWEGKTGVFTIDGAHRVVVDGKYIDRYPTGPGQKRAALLRLKAVKGGR